MKAPSFNGYSNSRLAEIATRVVGEFGSEELHLDREQKLRCADRETRNRVDPDEDDDEFEFTFTRRDSGQETVYPVFNRDLFLDNDSGVVSSSGSEKGQAVRLSLRKLFTEERETTMTRTTRSSSSETDDLDGLPSETYCLWRPKEEAGRCEKSSSAESSSKRWTLSKILQPF